MKFDRTILSKAFFPNFQVTVLALVLASIYLGIFVASFIGIIINEDIKRNDAIRFFLIMWIFYFNTIALRYFIYSTIKYKKIHNNKKLEECKSIQSDCFINDFIKDFVGECKNYELKIGIIISFSIVSSALNIISTIMSFQIITLINYNTKYEIKINYFKWIINNQNKKYKIIINF